MKDFSRRHPVVEGTYNFRDVGGFRTPNGITRWGTLFRSDGLASLTTAGQQALTKLGVGRVIDLRDDRERAARPDLLPEGIALLPHPIFPSALDHVRNALDVERLTEKIYLTHSQPLVAALDHLRTESTPTVVHCTAGKDRTGAVIALALTAVGVDKEDVFHDYQLTEERLRGDWLERHLAELEYRDIPVTETLLNLLAASPVTAIDRAMQRIEVAHGSVGAYLAQHGFDEHKQAELASVLVS